MTENIQVGEYTLTWIAQTMSLVNVTCLARQMHNAKLKLVYVSIEEEKSVWGKSNYIIWMLMQSKGSYILAIKIGFVFHMQCVWLASLSSLST